MMTLQTDNASTLAALVKGGNNEDSEECIELRIFSSKCSVKNSNIEEVEATSV